MFTKSKLERIYDTLCKEADEILKIYDPCHICQGTCTSGWKRFVSSLSEDFIPIDIFDQVSQYSFCCHGCKHLDKNIGCTTRNINCKLWLCGNADNEEGFNKRITHLQNQIDAFCFNGFRQTREEIIETSYQYFLAKEFGGKNV